LIVAISRMVLGLHYPTDVATGAILGVATAALVLAVN
jgi:undecaprenyl-diphosphatase